MKTTQLTSLRNALESTHVHERSETCIQSLPNELLLEIFSFLDLKSYIKCHSVCKDWLGLLPSTHMNPIRGRLVNLFRKILGTPNFERAFEWTDQNLQPFDREEYISYLLKQYPAVPEEFRMWILEWPARLAVQCVWPGLPFIYCRTRNQIGRKDGVIWMTHRPSAPQLLSLVYKEDTPSQIFIPALLIRRCGTELNWLVFEHDDPALFGRVFRTDLDYHNAGSIPCYDDYIPGAPTTEAESYGSCCEYCERTRTFDDWIDYIEYLWFWICAELEHLSELPPVDHQLEDFSIPQPVVCDLGGGQNSSLPAPAWDSCQRRMSR